MLFTQVLRLLLAEGGVEAAIVAAGICRCCHAAGLGGLMLLVGCDGAHEVSARAFHVNLPSSQALNHTPLIWRDARAHG
jgi:hypothetical protein